MRRIGHHQEQTGIRGQPFKHFDIVKIPFGIKKSQTKCGKQKRAGTKSNLHEWLYNSFIPVTYLREEHCERYAQQLNNGTCSGADGVVHVHLFEGRTNWMAIITQGSRM